MNDRFMLRLPFYNNNGEFSHFEFILIGDSLPAYNAGVMFHRGEYEQCTGLKDTNGNLIYEGDVVEITIFGSVGPNGGYVDSDEIYKGTVVWDMDCFLAKTDTDMILLPHSEDCIEICGNIHEQEEQKDNK